MRAGPGAAVWTAAAAVTAGRAGPGAPACSMSVLPGTACTHESVYNKTVEPDADTCCARCAAEAQCASWTFHRGNGNCDRASAPAPTTSKSSGATCGVNGGAPPTPGPAPLPSFSWDTVPVFAETSNVTGEFDAAALAALARFNMFVVEKAYDFPAPGFAEDKVAALAARLRELSPGMTLIFYYNTNIDMTDYRLHAEMAAHSPSWWFRDAAGTPVQVSIDSGAGAHPPFPYNYTYVFDHTVPQVRDAWVAECLTMAQRGYDGCFVDRWSRNPKVDPKISSAAMSEWSDARDLATAALRNATRAQGVWLIGGGDEVDATGNPGYGNHLALESQLAAAARGQGFLGSFKPGSTGAAFVTQLACFLTGAGTNHFFGAGSWTVDHTHRDGVAWYPEYDRPLGRPLGPAVLSGHVYTRRFAKGTNVTFDAKKGKGTIDWAA